MESSTYPLAFVGEMKPSLPEDVSFVVTYSEVLLLSPNVKLLVDEAVSSPSYPTPWHPLSTVYSFMTVQGCSFGPIGGITLRGKD